MSRKLILLLVLWIAFSMGAIWYLSSLPTFCCAPSSQDELCREYVNDGLEENKSVRIPEACFNDSGRPVVDNLSGISNLSGVEAGDRIRKTRDGFEVVD